MNNTKFAKAFTVDDKSNVLPEKADFSIYSEEEIESLRLLWEQQANTAYQDLYTVHAFPVRD